MEEANAMRANQLRADALGKRSVTIEEGEVLRLWLDAVLLEAEEDRSLLSECQHDPPCGRCQSCEIATLRARIADLERDRARLDFVADSGCDCLIYEYRDTIYVLLAGMECGKGATLRDATDAAMKAEAGEG